MEHTKQAPGPSETVKKLREISEGMRRLNPEAYNAAEQSVKRRMKNPAVRAAIAKASKA